MEEKIKEIISIIKKNITTIAIVTMLVIVIGIAVYLLRDTLLMVAAIAVLLLTVNLDNISEYIRQRLAERQQEINDLNVKQDSNLDYVKSEVIGVFNSVLGSFLGIHINNVSLYNPVVVVLAGVTVYRFTFTIRNCNYTSDDMAQWADAYFSYMSLPLGVSAVTAGFIADTYTFDIVYVNSKAEQQYITVARNARQARLNACSAGVTAPDDEDF